MNALRVLSYVVALGSATLACSQPVTYTATGTIRLLSHEFTDRFEVGDAFSFSFTYDPAATATISTGSYRVIPMESASLVIASNNPWSSLAPSDLQFTTNNSFSNASFDRVAAIGKPLDAESLGAFGVFTGTFTPISMGIELYAPYTLIGPTQTPTSLTLSNWIGYGEDSNPIYESNLFVQFQYSGGGMFGIRGQIDSLSAIPEPSTVGLALGGCALAGAVWWRKRKTRSQV